MSRSIDYKAVFDASDHAYMVLDRELRCVAANPAYLALTGTKLSELLGRQIFDLFPNDPAQPAIWQREAFETVLRTRQRHVVPLIPQHVTREGLSELRLCSAAHEPILDEHGEVAFIVQNASDVTAASGNRALGDQIPDLRSVFEQAPGFVCYLRGPQHEIVMANRAYRALVGGRELIGKPIREALPDVAGQGYFELLDEVTRSGEAFVGSDMRVAFEQPTSGTQEAIVDFVYQPITAEDGKVVGVLVLGQDVTQHRRQELRQRFLMQASECFARAGDDLDESLRQLARVASPGFADWAVVDLREPNGDYRRLIAQAQDAAAAPLVERSLHYPPASDHDTRLYRARGASHATLFEHVDDTLRRELAHDDEHLRLMQEIGVHSLLVVPLTTTRQHFGAITFVLARSRRHYEQADVAVAEELARISAIALDNARLSLERTELLQLEQAARERAEAANQAKDEFLAMLGHELRNPLAPILTAVQLMKLRTDGEPSREEVIIERQANHMVRLVDDLLDVSRIARGKVVLRQTPVDVASVVTSAVDIASPLLEQERHELTLDVARDLRVFGDEARLSQVVANLLTNAARYTPPRGRITLRAHAHDHNVVLRVTDNGVGISAELLPRVFDLFVQGPQHSDRAEGGLGLGLTLVRNIVSMHGGSVEARSAGKGRGAEFEIRLPALMLSQTMAPPDKHAAEPEEPTPCRVLIVDDNADAAELLAELLHSRGHETALAFDGPSALEEARRFEPAVAILDIGLPVMDGYELAAQLRAAENLRTPRLIALTGYGSDIDRTRSLAVGFFAHLVKPVDSDVLFRTVNSALAAR